MINQLISPSLIFQFDPINGLLDLQSETGSISLNRCRMQLVIRGMRGVHRFPLAGWQEVQNYSSTIQSSHGPLDALVYRQTLDDTGIEVMVTFALAQEAPMLTWKFDIRNDGEDPVWIEKIEFLRVGGQSQFGEFHLTSEDQVDQMTFFSNGWQSWSTTGAYQADQSMRVSRLGLLQQPMIVNHGTPAIRMKGYFTSDFFGALANVRTGDGFVAGFLSQTQQFGSIEALLYDRPSLAIWTADSCRLDPGASIETDSAVIMPFSTRQSDPLGGYLEAVAREYGLKSVASRPVPAGWCSWYHYYSRVTEKDILANLQSLETHRTELPLNLVQIDDGFESSVGDWFNVKQTFPNGMAELAAEITGRGMTPGLWLAPFILDRRSDFYHEHPEFILRTRRGNPVNAGFGWNGLTAAFDLTVPGALEAACQAAHTATHSWGYPYLKFDFLYAAALPGLHFDPTKTRAQIMRAGMQALRAAVKPDTYLLGCGLPLGSGIGLVDANRISCDVNDRWDPQFPGIPIRFKNEPSIPSVRNALQNILARAPMHNRWWVNDPDCLLLRQDSNLTLPEIHSMATAIGITGGSLLISDDLTQVHPERLAIAEVLLPVTGKRAEVLDLFERATPTRVRLELSGPGGKWVVAALFNWENEPMPWTFSPSNFGILDAPCWISSFWDGRFYDFNPGELLKLPPIPSHGVALFSIYPRTQHNKPVFLGSNLHFSQGKELADWSVEDGYVHAALGLGRNASGFIRVYSPQPPLSAVCNGQSVDWTVETNNVYRITTNVEGTAQITISF